jgi:hypothetical protein
MLAVDDGIFNGNFNFADVLFLIAAIVFGVATFIAFSRQTVESALVPLGLTLVSVALLVL